MENRESNILDYIYVIVKWKRFIILFSFLAAVSSVGFSLLLPKWYKAQATILIPNESSNIGTSGLLSQLGVGVTNFLDVSEEDNRYHAILQSRSVQEHIAKKFNLQELYQKRNLEETVRELRGHVNFGTTEEKAVYIEVEDRSPQRASDMTNEYVTHLDRLNKELQTEQAKSNRIFIENRVAQNVKEMKAAEDSLNVFQERYKVISLPEQIEAELKAYGDLYSTQQLKKIEYEMARVNLSSVNPDLMRIKSELDAIENNLRMFEISPESFKNSDYNPTFYVPFADIPQLFKEFARLQREVETQSTIYTFLTQQLEMAKLEEARDTPTLQILDRAVPPERKSRPKRSIFVLMITGIAFIFSISYAFTAEYFTRLGESSPEEREKLLAIKKMLIKRSRSDE